MATRKIGSKIDENESDKLETIKEKKNVVEKKKRPVFSELGNQVTLRPNRSELKETKSKINLRNAKPRVDTHWKKPLKSTDNTKEFASTSNALTAIKKASTLVRTISSRQHMIADTKQTNNADYVVPQTTKCAVKSKKSPIETKKEPLTIKQENTNLSQRSLITLKTAINCENKQQKTTIAKIKTLPQGTSENKDYLSIPELNISDFQRNLSYSMKLLREVEDIDEDDADNQFLVSEYVNDIYEYLFSLETKFFIKEDHLKEQKEVFPKMRRVLIDWLNEVHFQFHLATETFHMSVGIIDRYLQADPNTARTYLQLIGVTALLLAAKYEELFPPPIADFVYITDETYTKNQILKMEMKMFKTLDYNLSRPLPIHFLRRFSKAAKAEDKHHLLAKYFLELASVEYEFASIKPSEIAAASLNLAIKVLKGTTDDSIWTSTLEYYSHYTADQLKPLVQKIAKCVQNAPNAKLKAVYHKFQDKRFCSISRIPQLSEGVIDAIIEEKQF